MHEVCFAGWVPCSLATQPDHVFSAGLAPTSTSTCCWPWAAACVLFWLLCHGGLVVVVDVYCLSFLPHRQRVRLQGVLGLSLRCASRRRCCGWHSGWARLAASEQQGAVQCQQRPAVPLVLIACVCPSRFCSPLSTMLCVHQRGAGTSVFALPRQLHWGTSLPPNTMLHQVCRIKASTSKDSHVRHYVAEQLRMYIN